MRIAHTKEVCLFLEVTGVDQALFQQIFGMVEKNYLADIYNRKTNFINDTVAGLFTNLQENYGQLMPHKLLERDDIMKKTIYNSCDLIATVFSAVEELLKFAYIRGKLYTQFQAINVTYIILHRKGKFRLVIHNYNCMPKVQKMWVSFEHLTES